MHEWQLVFCAGFALGFGNGWFMRRILDWVRRTFWIAIVALVLPSCAHPLFVVMRVAGAGASIGHGANQAKKALEASTLPQDRSLAADQRRARAKADAELKAYRAEGCLR